MPPVLGVRQHQSTAHLLLHSKATGVRQEMAARAPGSPKPHFLPFPRGKLPAASTSERCYGMRQSLADFSPPYTAAAPSHSRALATAAPAAAASPGHPRRHPGRRLRGSGAAPCGPPGASSPPPGDKSETRGRVPPLRRCPPPARPLPAGLGAAAPAREEPGPGEGRPPAWPYPRVCG